jgi:YegS/Rv2252/BmrU family lipid kinase
MYHLILNPVAGKKKAQKNLASAEKIFKERGIAYEAHKTCAAGDASEIARRLTLAGETEIIVIGGDGTLHEVLNGIVEPSNVHLGLIPSGTGNDFAEKAGIPEDAEKALSLILDGTAKETDYLNVSGKLCMNVAGIGMDVDVLERCNRGKLKGKMKYLMSLLQSLFSFKGLPVCVESEGRVEKRNALIAAACNGAQFGGGIKICPNAEINDGLIDVVLVDCMGKWKMIKAFLQLMKGKILQYPLTTYFRCERVHFTPDTPVTVQLDGELYQELDFDVKLCKGLHFYR